MIDFLNVFDESIDAFKNTLDASELDKAKNSDARIRFYCYITMMKYGFFSKDSVPIASLIDELPVKYYPCRPKEISTFVMSDVRLRTFINIFSPYIRISLSSKERKSISDIYGLLPLTIEQINSELVERKVIANEVSSLVAELLFSAAGHTDVSISHVYPSSVSSYQTALQKIVSSKRSQRNSITRVAILHNVDFSQKQITTYIDKIVRTAEKIFGLIGVVELSALIKVAKLVDVNGREVEPYFLVKSVLSARDIFISFNDYAIIGEVDSSDVIHQLHCFCHYVKPLSIYELATFFSKVVDFKSFKSSLSKGVVIKSSSSDERFNSHKNTVSIADLSLTDKFSYAFIPEIFSTITFSSDVLCWIIEQSSVLRYVDDSVITFIEPESVNSDGYWASLVLLFRSSLSIELRDGVYCDPFYDGTRQDNIKRFSAFFMSHFDEKFSELVNAHNQFFSVKDNIASVDSENIAYSDGRRGEYVAPEIDVCEAEILRISNELLHLRNKFKSNIAVYSKEFKSEWKKKDIFSHDMYSNTKFLKDLSLVLSRSGNAHIEHEVNRTLLFFATNIDTLERRYKHVANVCDIDGLPFDDNEDLLDISRRIDSYILAEQKIRDIGTRALAASLSVQERKLEEEIIHQYGLRDSLKISHFEFLAELSCHDHIRSVGDSCAVASLREHYKVSISEALNKGIVSTLYLILSKHAYSS